MRKPTFETTWVAVTSLAETGARVEKVRARRARREDWLRRYIEAVLMGSIVVRFSVRIELSGGGK